MNAGQITVALDTSSERRHQPTRTSLARLDLIFIAATSEMLSTTGTTTTSYFSNSRRWNLCLHLLDDHERVHIIHAVIARRLRHRCRVPIEQLVDEGALLGGRPLLCVRTVHKRAQLRGPDVAVLCQSGYCGHAARAASSTSGQSRQELIDRRTDESADSKVLLLHVRVVSTIAAACLAASPPAVPAIQAARKGHGVTAVTQDTWGGSTSDTARRKATAASSPSDLCPHHARCLAVREA